MPTLFLVSDTNAGESAVNSGESFDGEFRRVSGTARTFADVVDGVGNFNVGNPIIDLTWTCHSSTDRYTHHRGAILLFETQDLPDDATVSAATLSLTGTAASNQEASFSTNPDVSLVLQTTVGVQGGHNDDYNGFGSVHQAPDLPLSAWPFNGTDPAVFILDSVGRGNISNTAVHKFGVTFEWIVDNDYNKWQSSRRATAFFYSTEETESQDERPVFTVTYSLPSTFTPRAVMF